MRDTTRAALLGVAIAVVILFWRHDQQRKQQQLANEKNALVRDLYISRANDAVTQAEELASLHDTVECREQMHIAQSLIDSAKLYNEKLENSGK